MPEDLRAHVRYPQDLFTIQAHVYATYHMQDPQVFFNKEDLLSIPRRTVDGRETEMEAYHTIMRLPGEEKEEFILLLPFTPNKRDNMRSWLAARSDGKNYGKLTALEFPKAKLVYGPKQIDARIDQDTIISQQLTLWSQRGSQVLRGSLLAIPIEKSLLYVQPIYLAAEQGSLPELKRVVVAFGKRIAMEETSRPSVAANLRRQAGSRVTTTRRCRGSGDACQRRSNLGAPGIRPFPAFPGTPQARQLGRLRRRAEKSRRAAQGDAKEPLGRGNREQQNSSAFHRLWGSA